MTAELLERPVIGMQPMLGSLPMPGMTVNHVGVTGTRYAMPQWQRSAWCQLIYSFRPVIGLDRHPRHRVELHHGRCVGADTDAHGFAETYGYDVSPHPALGVDEWQNEALMPVGRGMLYFPKKTADRNADIVTMADVMLAAPRYPEDDKRSIRSGTWQTIRMARALGDLPIFYAMPDGKLYQENA